MSTEDQPQKQEAKSGKSSGNKQDDNAVAKIRILRTGATANHFTFAAGKTVHAVPMKHAEFLEKRGDAQILEVS